MNDKELIAQILNREVSNILGGINPGFKMFASTVTNYIIEYINPYVDAFMSNDGDNKLNSKAAGAFLKEETSKKIEDFMKRFEEESKRNGTD